MSATCSSPWQQTSRQLSTVFGYENGFSGRHSSTRRLGIEPQCAPFSRYFLPGSSPVTDFRSGRQIFWTTASKISLNGSTRFTIKRFLIRLDTLPKRSLLLLTFRSGAGVRVSKELGVVSRHETFTIRTSPHWCVTTWFSSWSFKIDDLFYEGTLATVEKRRTNGIGRITVLEFDCHI